MEQAGRGLDKGSKRWFLERGKKAPPQGFWESASFQGITLEFLRAVMPVLAHWGKQGCSRRVKGGGEPRLLA